MAPTLIGALSSQSPSSSRSLLHLRKVTPFHPRRLRPHNPTAARHFSNNPSLPPQPQNSLRHAHSATAFEFPRSPPITTPKMVNNPFAGAFKGESIVKNSSSTSLSQADTSHSIEVRKQLSTHGLTPPNVESHDLQAQRCLKQLASQKTNIDKYIYLSNLRSSNVHLFYRLVQDHMTELTPLIYTPVVGEACQKWSEIYQRPEGMYLSYNDRGNLKEVIKNWPRTKVDITVVTDGSRILGLGDLGINGMGIPVGKLSLYTGCAGIDPDKTLPLTIDLGTNNEELLKDPFYMGLRMKRVPEAEEIVFMDELMVALTQTYPGIVVQFEDFKNPFPALARYQNKYLCFNDDIQGTGAVILGGMMSALRVTGIPAKDHRIVFSGAGSAAVGVAKQLVAFFVQEGLTEDEARRKFWLVDTKGLITNDRGDKLAEHKVYFARDDNEGKQCKAFADTVDYVKPTILIGLTGESGKGVFTQEIVEQMAKLNKNPIIFPLSNPSSKAECTFEDAVKWTNGQVVFASGSPFDSVEHNGETKVAGQGNNMYVFPGIGLGAILCKASTITQEMIYASGAALSTSLNDTEVSLGRLYPELDRIREVSVIVARRVIREAQREKIDNEVSIRALTDAELDIWIRERMYDAKLQTGIPKPHL